MSLRILLVKADLGFEEADVIVNSTNPNLDLHRGQLSKAILGRAGEKLQEDCRAKYPDGIQIGDIAVTNGGDLKFVHEIYHCVLPRWNQNTGQQTFTAMLNTLLSMVDRSKWRTLAIPALGTGRLAYPLDLIAKLMYDTVYEFGRLHPNTTIKDVLFVVHPSDSGAIESFEMEHCKYNDRCGNEEDLEDYRQEQRTSVSRRSHRK